MDYLMKLWSLTSSLACFNFGFRLFKHSVPPLFVKTLWDIIPISIHFLCASLSSLNWYYTQPH